MTSLPLIFRADATVAMGTGHVMRCLALAQAWQDAGGTCVFAMVEGTTAIAKRLDAEGFPILTIPTSGDRLQEASVVGDLARRSGMGWVVVDGYQFDSEYQTVLRDRQAKTLWIDDGGNAQHYHSELVLNQNAYAHRGLYPSREVSTRLLLGSRYVLLRREFSANQRFQRNIPKCARNILVTLGGSDPDNVTLKVIEALRSARLSESAVTIVIGGSNPKLEFLESAAKHMSNVRLVPDAENMSELMMWADVAISGAGTTCWEMCRLGLPAILVDLAQNQQPVANELSRRRIAVHVGSTETATADTIARELLALIESSDRRAEMAHRGQALVDGRGAQRVVAAIQAGVLRIRQVEEEDSRLLWEWSNDSTVRMFSFSTDPIPWETHVRWFHSKIENKNVLHYIAISEDGAPVGQVRFEVDGSAAVVSITLAADFRGKGFGSSLLAMATDELFRNSSTETVHAYVKLSNEPSLKLFSHAGFVRESTMAIKGQEAVHFVLEKAMQS